MAEVVKMPKMSDTMTDGVLAKWHKKVGDKIKAGDVLAEVETDKATMDFESYQEGTLLFIGVEEGQSVPVDTVIAVLGNEGEDYKSALGEAAPEQSHAEPEVAPAAEHTPEPAHAEPEPVAEAPAAPQAPAHEEAEPQPQPPPAKPKVDTSAIPATVIRMPALSDTMTEGVINKWHFKVGDKVKADDSLADVETDKATMEVVGYEEGTLLYIGPKEGEAAPVNGIIAIVGKEGADIAPLLAEAGITVEGKTEAQETTDSEQVTPPHAEEAPAKTEEPKSGADEAPLPAEEETQEKAGEHTDGNGDKLPFPLAEAADGAAGEIAHESAPEAAVPAAEPIPGPAASASAEATAAETGHLSTDDGRIKISPLARRIAKLRGIDLNELKGSADGGRIVKKDIEAFNSPAQPMPAPQPVASAPVEKEVATVIPAEEAPAAAPEPVAGTAPVKTAPPVAETKASTPAPAPATPAAPAPVTEAPKAAPLPPAPVKETPAPVAAASEPAKPAAPRPAGDEKYTEKPVSQMRRFIAKRLSESLFTAPHFYVTMAIDMDNAIAARTKINEVSTVKISFNDFVLKACAVALKQHPAINSSWLGDKIRYNQTINIGVAVAVDEGLLVPVVRNADEKSLSAISTQVKDFAARAKAKKLQPPDWEGSTFTISNLGMFGVDEFTAIINPPDACILAIGGIQQIPVVKNGAVMPGNVMKVTLSCDHRVVDGATGAAFLQTLKSLLQEPIGLLV